MILPSGFAHDPSNLGLVPSVTAYSHVEGPTAARAGDARAGAPTDNAPVSLVSTALIGTTLASVSDNFYNRKWVIPKRINFGRVLSPIAIEAEVWNAFFEPRDFSISADYDLVAAGVSLDDDAPGTLGPLESRIYTLTAETAGDPSFAFNVLWDMEGAGDTGATLEVFGSRIVAWPFRHNWDTPVLEQIAYKTDVLSGLSGYEQRRKLRNIPRRRVEMRYLSLDLDERILMEHLAGNHGYEFAVPFWPEASYLLEPAEAGANAFSVDTQNKDFEVGGYVMLIRQNTFDVLRIGAISSGSVETLDPCTRDYTTGTKVVPVKFGYLEDSFSLDRITSHVEDIRIAWVLTPDQTREHQTGTYSPTMYDGLEVFDEPNDYSATQTVNQSRLAEPTDNEVGLYRSFGIEPGPRRKYPFVKLIERPNLPPFLAWIENRAGRLTPFWWIDRVPAMRLATTLNLDSIFLTIKWCRYSTLAFPLPNRRRIAIRNGSGWLFREVVDATDNGDGTETLTLNAPPGVTIEAGTDPLICYARKVRCDSDQFELSYETSGVIRAAVNFIDLLT